MRRDLKIMWSSNLSTSNSGYGTFTKDLLRRLRDDKWLLASIGWAGLEGGTPIIVDGVLTYPRMGSVWGEDAMVEHGKHFGANVNFSMQDVWPLDPNALSRIPLWIPYVPIDKDPIPAPVLDRLKYANRIITFSKFGHDALERAGFASHFIPEGTDTNVFKPLDKMKAREEMKIPKDKFVFGMIGANKPDAIVRKGWQQALEAFKLFRDKHPESLFFYQSNQQGGFPIEEYAQYLGILPQIMSVNPYMSIFHGSSETVNKWLNCFDVLLHPSSTEGFGLVIIEAQAAGTPVIVNNCHSQPELVLGTTGEICDTGYKQWIGGGGFVYYPDTNSLHEKMEIMFDRVSKEEEKISNAAREHIVSNYNIDNLYKEKWVPFLENLQNEILPQVDTNPKKV